MSDGVRHPDNIPDDWRVLEISEIGLFCHEMPERTDAYFASYRADMRRNRTYLGIRAFFRMLRRARRGDYALIVLDPPFYPGWHPRSFLAAFKFSIFQGRPLEALGALISPLMFQALRFAPLPPCIVIERSDSFGIPSHQHFLLDKAMWFYKRELPLDHWRTLYGSAHRRLPGRSFRKKARWRRRLAKLRPIGVGIPAGSAEAAGAVFGSEKTTDVFYAAWVHGNSIVRERAAEQVDKLRAAGCTVDYPNERIDRADFMKRCAQAWITLSPEGLGWDCFRHVEAAIAGSVPLVNAPTIERYKPLVVGEHCLAYFPDEDKLVEVVREALADKARLTRMARAAHEHALANLTNPAMARDLLRLHGGLSNATKG